MPAPRERAIIVAERLVAEGHHGPALLEALRRHGFPEDEARLVANSFSTRAEVDTRWVTETQHKHVEERGARSLQLAALCIGGGVLVVMLSDAVAVGLGGVALGVALMVRGLALHWRARGV